MLRILSSLTLLCLLSVPDPHADWHSYLQKCETKYRAARHLKVTFLERYSENNRTVRVESGQAYFQKPGKMRWEYVQPEENLFLVDGKFTWFYSPADRTATRLPLKKSDDWRTPFSFLTGDPHFSRFCSELHPAKLPGSS